MSLNNEIKISVVPNPFKIDRIDKRVERKSFLELFEEHVASPLPIDHAVIFDNDIKINPDNYDDLPVSEHVIIKMLPAGGQASRSSVGQKVGGGLLIVLGAILIATGFGAVAGGPLLGGGISMFLGGWVTYWTAPPPLESEEEREKGEQTESIRGGRNKTRIDGMVPILLGKHLIIPDNAALPYVSNVDGDSGQYLHQLFCAGYNDIVIDTSTLKIGNTLVTEYKDVDANTFEIRYDGTSHNNYPNRIVQNTVGVELKREFDQIIPPVEYITRTSSTNTSQLVAQIVFPSGLIEHVSKGTASTQVVFIVQYSNYNDDNWKNFYGVDNYEVQGQTLSTIRFNVSKVLDNHTLAGSDYNDLRQYKVRIARETPNYNTTKIISTSYWDALHSYTGEYVDDLLVSTRPIDPSVQQYLATISTNLSATSQLNGVIDELNCIAQLHTLKYNGTGSGSGAWTYGATSNPSSMFRYILQDSKVNPHPIADNKVDWVAFETWYTFCETKGYTCNALINGDVTIEAILNSICSTGRGSWLSLDGKYTVIIDTYKPTPAQMFTPRNSWSFSGSKLFSDKPTVLKMGFIDAGSGYVQAERKVYINDLIIDDSISQSISLFGVTTSDNAWKHGKYLLANNELRPETFKFTADIENIVCVRGDKILLAHDAALIGLASGRIKAIIEDISGLETEGFYSDELLQYEVGKTYGVRIRTITGAIIEKEIINQASVIDTITDLVQFVDNILDITTIKSSDLFTYGETSQEVLELVVVNIAPNDDLEAVITCTNYAEAIFESDSGVIPTYNPIISVAGDGEVGGLGLDPYDPTPAITDLLQYNGSIAGDVARAGQSLIASRPEASSMLDDAYEVTFISSGEIVYVQKATSMLYKTRKTDSFAGVSIGTVIASNPAGGGVDGSGVSRVLYVNKEDNDRIYIKLATDTSTGTPVTTSGAERPRYIESDEFLYIGFDGFLYRGLVTDSDDGVQVTTFAIGHYDVLGATDIIYSNWADNSKLYMKSSVADDVGVKIGEATSGRLSISNSDTTIIYYINYDDDMNIYRKDVSDIDSDGVPAYSTALDVCSDDGGNVAFVSLLDSNAIYSGLRYLGIENGYLEASPNEFLVYGDITDGSTRISNMTADAISLVAVGDSVYHDGIPLDAIVIFKGPTYLTMDSLATVSYFAVPIQVVGTRIILDANRVIINGTVTANLMEASAINSKAKTVGGFYKSEIDLDSGAYKFRKDDDTIVLDFDADRTGSELVLRGDLDITSDDANRHIQVGSKGLLVKDSGTNIIHDLPDVPVGTDFTYCGHLLYKSNPLIPASNLTTVTASSAATFLQATSSLQTVTISPTDTGGNTNVKAFLLSLDVFNTLTANKSANYTVVRTLVTFYTDTTAFTKAQTIEVSGAANTVGFFAYVHGLHITQQVTIPVATDLPNSFVYQVFVQGSNMSTNVGAASAQTNLSVSGIYI